MSVSDEGGFLSRWSKRKVEAAREGKRREECERPSDGSSERAAAVGAGTTSTGVSAAATTGASTTSTGVSAAATGASTTSTSVSAAATGSSAASSHPNASAVRSSSSAAGRSVLSVNAADTSMTSVSARVATPNTTAAGTDQTSGSSPVELPSIESLQGLASDYRDFMRADVDPALKRAALRKLFADPHFNVMDGLDVYIDDYSIPDPIPEAMLATLEHAKPLFQPLLKTHDAAMQDAPRDEHIACSVPSLESEASGTDQGTECPMQTAEVPAMSHLAAVEAPDRRKRTE